MREFSSFHPLVLFLYFMSIFAIAVVIQHPVMVLIFLLCTTLFYIRACGYEAFIKSLPYKVCILILLGISNPLFVHQGVSILGYMNGNPMTLEAILYGVNFAFMMLGIWNLCACYQAIMDSEKFIYLFGCILPSFALIVTMSIRLFYKFKKQLFLIKDTQKMLHVEVHTFYISKARDMLTIFSILITWAFETSLLGANSMKARGYGVQRRINFHNYHFTRRDMVFLIICVGMSILLLILSTLKYSHFYFYPHIVDISYDVSSCIGYICYALYLVMPLLYEKWEEKQWISLRSKI